MLEKWFIDSDLLCYYKPSCGVLILYSNRFGVVTISYMTLGLEVLENFSLREKSLQIQISDFSIANEIFFASCPQIISHLAPFLLSTPTRGDMGSGRGAKSDSTPKRAILGRFCQKVAFLLV